MSVRIGGSSCSCRPPSLLGPHGCLERGALGDQVVPAEPADVVEREAAPECAHGWVAGGAIFAQVVQQLIEGLLA